MNEKRLPPRLMVLLVVLKGEKVYKIPLESGIKLDHLKDFNTIEEIQEYFEYVHLESQEIKFIQTTTAIKDI